MLLVHMSMKPQITEGGLIMSRIKIDDLPKSMKVSKEDMKKVFGGVGRVYEVMLGQYHGSRAGPAGPSAQTIVISDPSEEEAMFFAPEDLKSG